MPTRAMATVQIPLPVAAVLQDAKQGLFELMVSTGMQVFEAMLEQDREALCGRNRSFPGVLPVGDSAR